MPSFTHIDNTDGFGQVICKQEKEVDVNLVYNQAQVSTDIHRMSQSIHIFIDKEPLKNWIKPVVESENNSFNCLSSQEDTHFSFDTILKEKKPELGPEKQQQYAAFLSRFLSQTLFEYESKYLKAHNFFISKSTLNVHITLYKEALYIQTNFTLPVLVLENESNILSELDLEKLQNADKAGSTEFKSTTTYKIVLTEVPIDTQNLSQDTQQPLPSRIKIERSLLESKLTCQKEYEAKFNPHIKEPLNPPATENSRLLGLLRFFANKIISLLKLIQSFFKKNRMKAPDLKEESMDINSESIHQKEEKFKLDTLYFDPNLNTLARNLEDFPIIPSSEITKLDKSGAPLLKEEARVTAPTAYQNKDINQKESYLPEEEHGIHPANTDPTEKKVDVKTRSINRDRTKESKKRPSRLIFFKEKENKAYSNLNYIFALGKSRS